MKKDGSMRRWIILWMLLVTVFAAFAGWQEIKAGGAIDPPSQKK
jgi:hypothetical protein